MQSVFRLTCLLLFILPSTVSAAEISFRDDPETGCNLHLDGIIAAGDAQKLEAAYQANIKPGFHGLDSTPGFRGAKLCMNSPGGSIAEAFLIFRFLTSGTETAVTYIPKDAVCESACAVAFLAGGAGYYGSETVRLMHPTAKLGFHAPRLVVESGVYSEQEVDKSYAIALQVIAELLDVRRTVLSNPLLLPSSVLETMLRTPAEEMTYVETVGQAARWGISIFPVDLPQRLEPLNWRSVCENTYAMLTDSVAGDPHNIDWANLSEEAEASPPALPESGPPYRVDLGEGPYCEIDFDRFNPIKLSFFYQGYQGSGSSSLSLPLVHPEFMFYGADTRLRDLPLRSASLVSQGGDIRTSLMSRAKTARAQPQLTNRSCQIDSPGAEIVNVESFTNMRASPGLEGAIVARIPLGAPVSLSSPGRYYASQRCISACQSGDQTAIAACIDENDIWIETYFRATGGTAQGFLSRKFLEAQ